MDIDLASDSSGLIGVIRRAGEKARKLQRRKRWSEFMRRIPTEALSRMLPFAVPEEERDLAGCRLLYATMVVRALLYGCGGETDLIHATDEDLSRWSGALGDCLVCEFGRRSGAMRGAALPADPFAPDAAICFGTMDPEFQQALESMPEVQQILSREAVLN